MQRKRGELVPIGEVIADLDGPAPALRDGRPRRGTGEKLHGANDGAVQLASKQPRVHRQA